MWVSAKVIWELLSTHVVFWLSLPINFDDDTSAKFCLKFSGNQVIPRARFCLSKTIPIIMNIREVTKTIKIAIINMYFLSVSSVAGGRTLTAGDWNKNKYNCKNTFAFRTYFTAIFLDVILIQIVYYYSFLHICMIKSVFLNKRTYMAKNVCL